MSAERYVYAHVLVHFDGAVTNFLQAALPGALRPLLDAASFFGGTPGWLFLIGAGFWWWGSRVGVRVALVTSSSALLNVLAKWTLRQPRPYFVSAGITALEPSDGFGMPSGHAQGSAAAWSSLARWSGRRVVWMVGGVLTFLAGFARVYYGVHSLLQVVCGWGLGLAVTFAAAALEPRIVRLWSRAGRAGRVMLTLAPALVVFAIGLLLRAWMLAHWTVPEEWETHYRAAALALDPAGGAADLRLLDLELLARWTGALLGASLAAAWWASPRRAPLEIRSWTQRLVHTTVGLGATLAVLGAGASLVRVAGDIAELVRFTAALLTLAVGAPWIAELLCSRPKRLPAGR